MIALGALAAVEIGRRRWVAAGGGGDDVADVARWAIGAGLVGARLYHVATDWKSYQGRWFDVVKVWEGGLGIPGGLLAGAFAGYLVARSRGWDTLKMFDAVIPGIPVAQAIGRLGNWFNQEIFGKPSDLPWAVEIDLEHRPLRFADSATFHPAFLYEGLWNLALAGFLILISNRKILKPGQILPLWIMGYGVGRSLVELMRTDAASIVLGLRINTWVSGIAIIGGLLWFLYLGRRGTPSSDSESDIETDVDSDVDADSDVATEDLDPQE